MKTKLEKGFTLIEILVYIAILVLMLGIIVQVVFSVARAERVMRSTRSIENSATLALERISREVREADSINTVSSLFGAHPGRLSVTGVDESGNPETIEFSLSNGRIALTINGALAGYLTEENANIVDLKFYFFSTGASAGIKTELTLESGTSTHYRVEKFYSTSITR